MPNPSPWDGISVPKSELNVRQAAGNTIVPCFWGRDAMGSCLFIVELEGDHTAQYQQNAVAVNGIAIDLRTGKQGQQRLILSLGREVDRDLFESLCRSLVSSLEHASDSVSSLSITLTHLRRWKSFLSGRAQNLSAEEIRGLFAEIVFLLELNQHLLGRAAVDAWLGPERSHQDFIFGNTAVEIKSLSGTERSAVRISSEDQLESLNDSLFLRIYRLSNLPDAIGARSLNEIVAAAHTQLGAADATDIFEQRLSAHGYAPLPEYDHPRFVVSEVSCYRVRDDFPRLIRSQMPIGVSGVSYDIRLESIAAYACQMGEVFGEL